MLLKTYTWRLNDSFLLRANHFVPASTMAKSLSILLLLIIGTISSSFAFAFIAKPGSSKRISYKKYCSRTVVTKMTVSTSTIDVAKQTTPNKKVIKAVIFDMDGTLLDTVSCILSNIIFLLLYAYVIQNLLTSYVIIIHIITCIQNTR